MVGWPDDFKTVMKTDRMQEQWSMKVEETDGMLGET